MRYLASRISPIMERSKESSRHDSNRFDIASVLQTELDREILTRWFDFDPDDHLASGLVVGVGGSVYPAAEFLGRCGQALRHPITMRIEQVGGKILDGIPGRCRHEGTAQPSWRFFDGKRGPIYADQPGRPG